MGESRVRKIITKKPVWSLTQRKNCLWAEDDKWKSQLKKLKVYDGDKTVKGVYWE
jgi:hypothetical protein